MEIGYRIREQFESENRDVVCKIGYGLMMSAILALLLVGLPVRNAYDAYMRRRALSHSVPTYNGDYDRPSASN